MNESDGSLTRRLARMVRARDVDDTDRSNAERFIRDWLGSYVAGSAATVGSVFRAYGDASRDLETRTFLAAALSHVTETDDLHRKSVTHPGCVVIPVALLLGRESNAGGHRVLRAVLAGYEVMTRIGEALGAVHYRIFHSTATAGVFGAAASAATLLDLDEDQWVWALGSAGTQAAGLWQFNQEAAMSKPLHVGHAASTGLKSALLAARGVTGAERILEGEKGLFAALCPDARPGEVLAEAAGWKLPETSMKPYPCCRHVHPAIDAALKLRDDAALELRGDTDGSEPARVHVESYPAALDIADRPFPRTPHEARFSLQYAVATALLRGRPGLETFEPPAIDTEGIRALLPRVTVESDATLAAAFPERWGARVCVERADGTKRTVVRHSATGDPDQPLDDPTLDAKVEGLFRWADVSAMRTKSILTSCRALIRDGSAFGLPKVAVRD